MRIDRELSFQIGAELRSEMLSWSRALSPLSRLLSPIRSDGAVPPLFCATDGTTITFSWYAGLLKGDVPDIIVEGIEVPSRDWPTWSSRGYDASSFWARNVAKEALVSAVKGVLGERKFPAEHDILMAERLWAEALAMAGVGSLYDRPIEISSLLQKLTGMEGTVVIGWPSRLVRIDADRMRARLLRMESIRPAILPPFPTRDLTLNEKARWIWDGYSDQQLAKKVVHTYLNALNSYKSICDEWLSPLKGHMRRRLIMPATLIGVLAPPLEERGPVLEYHLEPLPIGEENRVEVEVRGHALPFEEVVKSVSKKLQELRPDVAARIGVSRGAELLGIFESTPVTDLTYRWLEQDLRSIKWA